MSPEQPIASDQTWAKQNDHKVIERWANTSLDPKSLPHINNLITLTLGFVMFGKYVAQCESRLWLCYWMSISQPNHETVRVTNNIVKTCTSMREDVGCKVGDNPSLCLYWHQFRKKFSISFYEIINVRWRGCTKFSISPSRFIFFVYMSLSAQAGI